MNPKNKLSYLLVVVLALAFSLTSLMAVAKNDNAKNSKSSKSSQSQGKSQTINLKNFEKADKVKGTTNAQIHKEKSEEVTKNLKEAVDKEKTAGDTKVSNQIQQVVVEQEQIQEQTTEAIEEVEDRGKFKTFIVGENYKNLGQLRSSLVHNRNEIRKLTRALTQTQTAESQALIEAQLATLTQERERIKSIITTNEGTFSLFGWVFRFLNNYEQTPINEQEENALTEEVEDAIDAAEADDASEPEAAEGTPAPTDPAAGTETVPVVPVQ